MGDIEQRIESLLDQLEDPEVGEYEIGLIEKKLKVLNRLKPKQR